jgi:murein DD-endopeptidase MepM/ murein hydrolase activator NlpD
MSNPCDNPPVWPQAPKPSHNPLASMQWASGQDKDKFGCTRKDAQGKAKFHAGIDIKASVGTDCHAIEDSKVEEVSYGADLGKYVSISYAKDNKTYGVVYCHLSVQSVKKGESVKAGDLLGKTGVTGNAEASNPHLHLEIQDQVWVGYPDATSRSKHGLNPNHWL